jgi:cytochrome bd ubiquinol oxidase subunit II
MSPGAGGSWEAVTIGATLLATMAAYALFEGADFGGGLWDLLAGGTESGKHPRAAIDRSVTPVWEGNQTWIVLGIVFLWTGFPTAFAAVMTALFVPLSLSLLGILLRGIGFAFRHEAERLRMKQLAGVLFAASSFVAPFFLGVSVGAVATGRVRPHPPGNVWSAWINPTALVTGVLFVSSCAYIGAVYLVGDSHRRGDEEMVRYFSRRVLASGVVTGALAGGNIYLLSQNAHYVSHRLLGPALPLVIVSVVAGAAAFLLVLLRRFWLLRISAGLAVTAVVAAWGVAQYPFVLPGSLTLRAGSAPRAALLAEIAVLGLAALLVVPSFFYLYFLQQHDRLEVTSASDVLARAVAEENAIDAAADEGSAPPRPHRLVAAVIIGAALADILRDATTHKKGGPARSRFERAGP